MRIPGRKIVFRPTAAEYLPAVLLLVVGQWELWVDPVNLRGSRLLLGAGMAIAALCLIGRRRWPVPVLLLVGGSVLIPAAAGSYVVSVAVVFTLVVAVFSTGRYGARPVAYLGVPLGIGIALLASTADPQETLDSSWGWALNVVWIFGLGAWLHQAHDLVTRTRHEAAAVARAAAAEERLRLAQDLHDVLAHSLSVMVVQAEVADELLDVDNAAAHTAIGHVRATGRDALAETRNVLGVLRAADMAPAISDLENVGALVHSFRSAGLPVTLDCTANLATSPQVGRTVYRTLQESLTNALRHAHSPPTRVRLRSAGGRLVLDVENDGDHVTSTSTTGNGLRGMRERIEASGGTLHTGPRPEGGFVVHAEIPLTDRATA